MIKSVKIFLTLGLLCGGLWALTWAFLFSLNPSIIAEQIAKNPNSINLTLKMVQFALPSMTILFSILAIHFTKNDDIERK